MRPDLTLSIISANNLNQLLPCLRSVFENTRNTSLEVYVVDNASTDGTAAAVRAEFSQVRLIHNEQRLGFSSNNNMVMERGKGRYLMLLNDDTTVLDGALDRLVEFMDAYPQAGAVGSFLLNPDGSFQSSFARFPRPLSEAIWPATNWSYRSARRATKPVEVDWVCGAALLVRDQVVEQVGMLDAAFDPIYSEEVEWCYRVRKAGWPIYAHPQAQIIHYGSQTMNRVMPHKYELLLSHKMQFFRKHGRPGTVYVYRSALTLMTAIKVVWWTLASLIGRERQASQERVQLHRHLLERIPSL